MNDTVSTIVRGPLTISELHAQLRDVMSGHQSDLCSLDSEQLPPSELQRLAAIAIGEEGIVGWLDIEPVLPETFRNTSLEKWHATQTPFNIMEWLAGMRPRHKTPDNSKEALPPGVGLVYLWHIWNKLGLERLGQ